jgi:hypothetical protein
MPRPINEAADAIDLRPRVVNTNAIVGSPAAASETIVAQTAAIGDVSVQAGVLLFGWVAFTVGGSGTAARLRVRQTNVGGTIVADTGALTVTAGNLVSPSILGFDAAAVSPSQVYVLTLTITAGAATSTVSATQLTGIID